MPCRLLSTGPNAGAVSKITDYFFEAQYMQKNTEIKPIQY